MAKTKTTYKWDEWLNLGAFTLVRGKHYHCTQAAICGQVRNEASRRHLYVSVVDAEDRVIVTVKEKSNAPS